MTDRDPRRAILARRAHFVAAAIAGVGLAASCKKEDGPPPGPCLSMVMPDDAGSTADTAATGTSTAPSAPPSVPAAEDASEPPKPCLSVSPHPCLDVAPPPVDAGPKGPTPKPPPPQPMPCLSQTPH